MATRPAGLEPPDSSADWALAARARLEADGFIAYPTETVWGLGACVDRPLAVDRLLAWKGRASDAPLAVLVSAPAAAAAIGCELTPPVVQLMERFWPGPLMLVVPCRGRFAPGVAREDGALGLRCSPHPVAAGLVAMLEQAGLGPLTSTSFNRSGEPPARLLAEAKRLIEAEPATGEGALDRPLLVAGSGPEAGGERPSTVVDCTAGELRILREGAIPGDAIRASWRR